jgi:hypothetical protein
MCRLLDNVEKNIVDPDRPEVTIWRVRIACCIPKATATLYEYVTLTAFHGNDGYANAHCLSFLNCTKGY